MNLARTAGAIYVVTFVAGLAALFTRGAPAAIAGVIAAASYVAVTILFYFLFRPVNGAVSLTAMIVGLAGCGAGPLLRINPLPIFGVYCLLVGYLILRSRPMPAWIGGLMLFAACGWMTFLSRETATSLAPYNYLPGIVGEGALTIWLIAVGVRPTPAQRRA